MLTDEAVFCSATPISSAIAMNRLPITSSMTGSTSVPIAGAAARGLARVRMRLPSASTSACQPGSTTVVADGSMIRAGPETMSPGARSARS